MKKEIIYAVDQEIKNKFIDIIITSDYSIAQTNQTRNVLLKVNEFEINKNKKAYEFSTDEMKEFLRGMNTKSISTLNTYYSIFNKYIEYIMENDSNIIVNNFKALSSKDMIELIDQVAHDGRYITREELFKLIANAVNPQDKALFILLFEGVRGKGYDDLRLLREKKVDFENDLIHLPNKTIKIRDRRSKFILKSAIAQTQYYSEKINADTGESEMVDYGINPKNKYVIKRIMHKNKGIDPYLANRIKVKIAKFAKEMGREYLTGNTIYNSGLAERFLEHFNYRSPETVSTIEINNFLEENKESIQPAKLREISNYILGR